MMLCRTTAKWIWAVFWDYTNRQSAKYLRAAADKQQAHKARGVIDKQLSLAPR